MNVVVRSFSRYSGNTMLTAILAIAINNTSKNDVVIVTEDLDNYAGLFKECRVTDTLYKNEDMKRLSIMDGIQSIKDFSVKLTKGLYIADIRNPELIRGLARSVFMNHSEDMYLYDVNRLLPDIRFNQGQINKYVCVLNDTYTKKKEFVQGLSHMSELDLIKTIIVCNKVSHKNTNQSMLAYDLKQSKNTINLFPWIANFRDWNVDNKIFDFVYRTYARIEGMQEYYNPLNNLVKKLTS